jgi:UDP-glucose:(heptosyl)LPS alpha-1,3-glucosyltransferase
VAVKKKIAVVVPKFQFVGGAERFAAETTGRLAKSTGHEFHVFANRCGTQTADPIFFHRIPRLIFPRSLRPWAFALLVDRAVARGNFDLVHSHERVFRADFATLHGMPHRAWIREIRKKRMSLFDRSTAAVEQRLLRNGAGTIFQPVSLSTLEVFQSEFRTLPGTWQVIHPGVDFGRFSSPERGQCRSQILDRHGFAPGALVVLFVGMNFQLKGLDAIMETVADARKQCPESDVCLLVVGKGAERRYSAKARQLGIGASVSFAGTVRDGIEQYYRAADILMMLSGFDSFGMSVLEAMAAGLPVIIGPNVGAREIIENGTNGFVLQQDHDTRMAAHAIMRLSDPQTRFHIAASAQKTALAHDWGTLASRISNLYSGILNAKQ